MSLFNRAPAPVERRTMSLEAALSAARGRRTSTNSGQVVNSDTAMRLGTVWACVNLLSELVGVTIDYHQHTAVPDGTNRRDASDPLILTNPSPVPNESAIDWRKQIVVSWLLRGNAWGLVTARDERGRATQIQIINPDVVSYYRRGVMGPVEYRVLGTPMDLYPVGNLWHKPLHVVPGFPVGLSPIEYGAQGMGLGLAAEEFGARWFGDGATPSSVLTSDQVIEDDVADTIKARFVEAVRGTREPAVLGRGLSYQQVSVKADESQFLDTIKANRTTVAQFFGMTVAPDLVGAESGGSLTYSNTEQQNLNVLLYAASGLVTRMEALYTELTSRPKIVVADLEAILRVDAKTRAEIEASDLRAGKRGQNEIRKASNLPPVPGGDRLNWPPYANSFVNTSASGEGDEEHPLAPSAPAPTTTEPATPEPVDDPAAEPPEDPAEVNNA